VWQKAKIRNKLRSNAYWKAGGQMAGELVTKELLPGNERN